MQTLTRLPLACALLRSAAQELLLSRSERARPHIFWILAGGDWKGSLVQNAAYIFGGYPRIRIPKELHSREEFLRHLKVTDAELKKIWWFRDGMYHTFTVKGKSGKERIIHAPDKRLKMLQKDISDLLDALYTPRNCAHGFIRNKSVVTNARSHLDRKFLINIDLKSFFPSISENRVEGLLCSLGVNSSVAEIITKVCCYRGVLPQGAPSSPIISNMICFRLDKNLMHFAKRFRLVYTRYADDITLSAHRPLSCVFKEEVPSAGKFAADKLHDDLIEIIKENGFELNEEKCHYSTRNSRRVVTGVKVNEFLNIDRDFYKSVRSVLFRIEKDGLGATQKHHTENYKSNANLVNILHGKIEWIAHIKGRSDPIFRKLTRRYNELFPENAFSIEPTLDQVIDRSVWVLEDADGVQTQGTAFFLDGVGLVTAAHCVMDNALKKLLDTKFVIFHAMKPANRFVVSVSKHCSHRDLAILSHSLPVSDYYQLKQSERSPDVGEDISSLGFPSFSRGDQLNNRKGTLSSVANRSAVKLLEVTQKHSQGMSGGPVLLKDGSVCGVVHKGGPHEARDFAVSIEMLRSFVSE